MWGFEVPLQALGWERVQLTGSFSPLPLVGTEASRPLSDSSPLVPLFPAETEPQSQEFVARPRLRSFPLPPVSVAMTRVGAASAPASGLITFSWRKAEASGCWAPTGRMTKAGTRFPKALRACGVGG